MKFTDKTIAALELPRDRAEMTIWDPTTPGFGVRIRPTSRTWRIQYRIHHQQRSESLGDVRKVSMDAARKIARQRFAKIELGIDPGAERDAARRAATAEQNTLGRTVDRYLEARKHDLRRSTYSGAVRYLREYWRPLHDLPLDAIKRVRVASVIHDLVDKHGRTAARDARKNLSALYAWAMREGLAEANPVIGSNNPAAGSEPRERTLDDAELRAIWQVCDAHDDDYARVVRLLLLTACRRQEIGGLRWDEIDLQTGVVSLPGSRTKNKRAFQVTLPEPALAILCAQPRQEGRPFVFGRAGATGLTGWSWHRNRFERHLIEVAERPIKQWGLHDLRRTVATRLGDMNVAPHVIDAVLAHAKPALHAVYNQATYRAEKAQALALWADKLAAIVEQREPLVLPLQRA